MTPYIVLGSLQFVYATRLVEFVRVKNAWNYASTQSMCLHGVVLKNSTGTTLPLPLL